MVSWVSKSSFLWLPAMQKGLTCFCVCFFFKGGGQKSFKMGKFSTLNQPSVKKNSGCDFVGRLI